METLKILIGSVFFVHVTGSINWPHSHKVNVHGQTHKLPVAASGEVLLDHSVQEKKIITRPQQFFSLT